MLAGPPLVVLGGIRALWNRPAIITAAILCLACVPEGRGAETGPNVTAADVAALALVAVIALQGLVGGGTAAVRGRVLGAGLALICAALVATMTATDVNSSLAGVVRYVQIFVAVPFAVALSLRTHRDFALAAGVLIGVGLVEGGIGVFQFLTGTGAGYGTDSVRAVGTFGAYDIMTLSTLVSYALLAALALALAGRGSLRQLGGWSTAFLLMPLALSLSRGAWIAAGAAILVVILVSGWQRVFLLLAVTTLVGIVGLGVVSTPNLGVLASRAESLASSATQPDRSVRDRYDLWNAALEMWRDHPITGVGLKNFAVWRDTYAPLSLSAGSDISDAAGGFRRVELLSPHNLYLLILSEQGVVGALAFAAFILTLGALTVSRLRRARPVGLERTVGLFAAGVLVRFLVDGLSGDIGGIGSLLTGVALGGLIWFAGGLSVWPAREARRPEVARL